LSTILKGELGDAMYEARSQLILDELAEKRNNFSVISGHFRKDVIYPVYEKEKLLTIFREPTSRVISQYANWRDDARVEWDTSVWPITLEARQAILLAQKSSLEGFLSSDNIEILANTKNVLTRAFCDEKSEDPHDENESMIESAFENLRNFFWLGIMERVQESFILLSRQLGLPQIAYGYLQVHNSSQMRYRCDRSTRELLRDITKMDRRLYRLVEQEFDRRLKTFLMDGLKNLPFIQKEERVSDEYFHFMAGWSYLERTPDGRRYRWSYADAEALVSVPVAVQSGVEYIDIEAEILAFGDGIGVDSVEISLDYVAPIHHSWALLDTGVWLFSGRFPACRHRRAFSVIAFSTPQTVGNRKALDPRERLGVALSKINARFPAKSPEPDQAEQSDGG
jgi:hypothetical protein